MKTRQGKLSAINPTLNYAQIGFASTLLLLIACVPRSQSAGIVETFSYSDGNLITVSGGAWQSWGGGGPATVTNGMARYEDNTDVIRAFEPVLTGAGQTATFSFTINIAVANTTEGYEMAFEPSSAPFGFGNTNYGSGLALGFDYLTGPAGMSTIQVAEGSGIPTPDNSTNNIVQVGTMSAGVTHTISISLARGAANTSYSLFLDNTLLRNGTLIINDARAINSVEFDQAGSQGTAAGFAIIDNLMVVPESTTYVALAWGASLTLLTRRRAAISG